MITTNIHTHTVRCGHAKGEDREYIEAAIKAGYKVLGFSDHGYRPEAFKQYYMPYFTHADEIYADYISSLRKLREEYKDKIEIHIGFEVEYQRDSFEQALAYYKNVGAEYLILGQHCCENSDYDKLVYAGLKNASIESFDKFIEQCIDGMRTGYFTYLAHPDLFNYVGDENLYKERIEYFVSQIKKYNIPVEFNVYGFAEKRNYPNEYFWQLAGENGIDAILGIDAHDPNRLLMVEHVESAIKYLEGLNVKVVEPKIKKI